MQEFYLARASISAIVTKAVFTEVKGCMFVVGNVTFPMTSNTDGFVYLLPFPCISLKLPAWAYFPHMKQTRIFVDFSLLKFIS